MAASSKKRFARLSSGWLLITHLSNARKEKYLRIACEVAGIPFNDPAGLKISLTTSTGSNLKEKVPYILLGKSYNVKSAVEAYVSIFDVLSRRDGTFLERIQPKMKGRKLSMVARNQADVGPSGRPRQLSSGWWLYTNLSNRNKLRYLRIACDVAGIPFGDPGGLKIDL